MSAAIFTTEDGIEQFAEYIAEKSEPEKKSIKQAFTELIDRIVDAIKRALSRGSLSTYQKEYLEMEQKQAEKIRTLFLSSLDKAAENYKGEIQANTETSEQKNNTDESGAKYSIDYTEDNKPVVVIDENILENVPKSQWVKTVKDTISNKFSQGIPVSGRLIKVNAITRSEYTSSKRNKYLKGTNGTIYADKFKSANNLDEIVLASTNYVNEDLKHKRKDSIKEFARGNVLLDVGGNKYSADVIIGLTSSNNMLLYDVINLKKSNFDSQIAIASCNNKQSIL